MSSRMLATASDDPDPTKKKNADEGNLFKKTANELRAWVQANARDTANRHVMSVYFEPLCKYLAGSPSVQRSVNARARKGQDLREHVRDLVGGFLASRLGRSGYLEGWLESGKPLRKYLVNGLWLYWREQMRARDSVSQEELDDVSPVVADTQDADLDRQYLESLIRYAKEIARAACEARGYGLHWRILEEHICQDRTYNELAPALEVSSERAAVMLRTSSAWFEQSFRDVLLVHVPDPERLPGALRAWLALIGSEAKTLGREGRTAGLRPLKRLVESHEPTVASLSTRSAQELVERLMQEDGARWLAATLAEPPLSAFGSAGRDLIDRAPALERIVKLKDLGKIGFRGAEGSYQARLRGGLAYSLALAAALAHHGTVISRLPAERLRNHLVEVAAALPLPWSDFLVKALETLSQERA